MASNTPHPLQPPPPGPPRPTGASSSGSSGGSGGGGIGRSAPIAGVSRGPPGGGSLPGGLATPPLVKGKLALTPGPRAQPRPPLPGGTAGSAAAAYSQPPPAMAGTPITLSRKTSGDPVLAARHVSPGVVSPGAAPADELLAARQVSPGMAPEAREHVVRLPPTSSTGVHPLHAGGASQQQQPQQLYQASSPQPPAAAQPTHPLQQPYHLPSQPTTAQQTHPLHLSPPKGGTPAKSPAKSPIKSPAKSSPKKKRTPDEEIDIFLLGDSSSSSVVPLHPAPLPTGQSVLDTTRTLAGRRAWGDVVRVTNDALVGKDVGMHHACYAELLAAAANDGSGKGLQADASTVAKGAELEKLRNETAELLALRFVAQLKLRRYADLGKEVDQLGLLPHLPDRDDLPWKEGSMHSTAAEDALPSWVPFGLRLAAASQLQYNDGSSKAIDVLYDLRDRAVRTEYWNTAGMEVWRPAIDNALVNAFVRKREWRLALRGLDDLLGGLEDGVAREVDRWCAGGSVGEEERVRMRAVVTAAAQVELRSRQLLVLLQSGAVAAAEAMQQGVQRCAAEARPPLDPSMATLARMTAEMALVRQVPVRLLANEGLLLFSRMKYADAAASFRDALRQQRELDPIASTATQSPPECPAWKDLAAPTLGFDAPPTLTVECLNGLSLCLLYGGDMRSAVGELEGWVREDPRRYLTEGVAFNLCTLYELGSDGEECARRKRLLQRLAKRFYLHDVGAESFRLG